MLVESLGFGEGTSKGEWYLFEVLVGTLVFEFLFVLLLLLFVFLRMFVAGICGSNMEFLQEHSENEAGSPALALFPNSFKALVFPHKGSTLKSFQAPLKRFQVLRGSARFPEVPRGST